MNLCWNPQKCCIWLQFLIDFSPPHPLPLRGGVARRTWEKEMKTKNPKQCACAVIHRFDQPRAVSFKAVCWEGPGAMPLEFLLFFVVRLLTPETEELICINMVVMVMVLVVGWAASPLPVWHFYLNTSLHPCSPQQQLFSFSFSSDRNWDHWCARLGELPTSTGTEAVGGCAQPFKPSLVLCREQSWKNFP